MSQIPQQGGASVHARGRIPSTDLASLIDFLVKAFPPDEDRSDHPLGWPVLTFYPAKKRLGINIYAILRRFLAQREMRDAFRQTETTGFLCDLVIPPKSFTAKMGGRMFNDNIAGLSQNISKLKRLIADEIERLGISSENIEVSDPASALQNLAQLTGLKHFLNDLPAQMVAMEFAKTERPASLREKDVARVLSALEEIQAEDWLERMAGSIANTQAHRDDEFGEIQRDKLIETLRQDFDKNDSQVTRFLNFLEDEALARVRLNVSFAIMKGLGVQVAKSEKANDKAFVDYVQRVVALFEYYGTPESAHSMHLNLSRDYGLAANFSVSQELVKAMFYNCLPVWSEWNTQLFESRRVDPSSRGVSVVREVSYRFRVNGKDPRNEMFPAFDSRLMRLREVLLDASANEQAPFRLRRGLSEVVFLWLVLNPAINSSNIPEEAEELTAKLNTEGKTQVEMLLQDLSSWNERVKGLSKTLVDLLRTKSRTVIAHAQRSIDDLYLVVQQGVVDWSAIERSRGKVRDPLVKPTQGQNENAEWFKHIKIARKPDDVLEPLFSVRVRTALNERTLAMRENGVATTRIVREAPEKLLNITWMPIRVDEKQNPIIREQRAKIDRIWRMGAGVDIWYEPEQLKQRDNPKYTEEDRRHYRAAAATALSIKEYLNPYWIPFAGCNLRQPETQVKLW
ncbi:MAG: hypothetical protein ACRERU_23890 [Methylococcales bacterium]